MDAKGSSKDTVTELERFYVALVTVSLRESTGEFTSLANRSGLRRNNVLAALVPLRDTLELSIVSMLAFVAQRQKGQLAS